MFPPFSKVLTYSIRPSSIICEVPLSFAMDCSQTNRLGARRKFCQDVKLVKRSTGFLTGGKVLVIFKPVRRPQSAQFFYPAIRVPSDKGPSIRSSVLKFLTSWSRFHPSHNPSFLPSAIP